MVVMGHVITFCIRDLDRAAIFKFIAQIHMPLFFFISGWLTFGLKPDGALRAPSLGKRFRQLIIPMIVVSTLWIYYFPHSGLESPLDSTWKGLWLSEGKNGYWFTLCLFEIFVIYALIRPILGRAQSLLGGIAVCGIAWTALLIANHYILPSHPDIAGAIGLGPLTLHFPGFMAGYLASRHRDGFNRLTNSPTATGISMILGAVAIYFLSWWWDFGDEPTMAKLIPIVAPVFYICLAIVAIAVVRPWTDAAYAEPTHKPGPWVQLWTYLGKNSLGIYLLHYFFLFPLGILRPALESMNVAFVPMLAIALFAASVIVTLTLGVIRILRPCPPLARLLTGQ